MVIFDFDYFQQVHNRVITAHLISIFVRPNDLMSDTATATRRVGTNIDDCDDDDVDHH